MMEALGKVILSVPEEVNTKIKETIAKVKDNNNYDTNAKALSNCTKSDLQVTLAFLLRKKGDSEIKELLRDRPKIPQVLFFQSWKTGPDPLPLNPLIFLMFTQNPP